MVPDQLVKKLPNNSWNHKGIGTLPPSRPAPRPLPRIVKTAIDSHSELARQVLRCAIRSGLPEGEAAVGVVMTLGISHSGMVDLWRDARKIAVSLLPQDAAHRPVEGATLVLESEAIDLTARQMLRLAEHLLAGAACRVQMGQNTGPLESTVVGMPPPPSPPPVAINLNPESYGFHELVQGRIAWRIGALDIIGAMTVTASKGLATLTFQCNEVTASTNKARTNLEASGPQRARSKLVQQWVNTVGGVAGLLNWKVRTCEPGEDVYSDEIRSALNRAHQRVQESDAARKQIKTRLKNAEAHVAKLAARLHAEERRARGAEEARDQAGRRAHQLELKLASLVQPGPVPTVHPQGRTLDAALDQVRKERDDLAAERDALRQDLHALRERLRPSTRVSEASTAATPQDPANYAELAPWVEREFAGRLVLTRRAAKSGAASLYYDPSVVFGALRAMADQLHPVLSGERPGALGDYQDALLEVYCEDSAVGEAVNNHRFGDEYRASHRGRTLTLDRHVKRGATFDPRSCLRIYYAWDDVDKVIVVGSLTAHLTNSLT